VLRRVGGDRDVAAARAHLDPVRFEAQAKTGPLSAREQEVAALIARGLTNRQIAEALVITTSTVERHVLHIFTKLGVSSRTQIAVWVTAHLQP
jgi:DNA-binding NarL/FixJ family response regulator